MDGVEHVAYTEPIYPRFGRRYRVACETCGWEADQSFQRVEDARTEGLAHEAEAARLSLADTWRR